MKRNLADYKVAPRVVLSGKETAVCIVPRGYHGNFKDDKTYKIVIVPMENSIFPRPNSEYPTVFVNPENGILKFTYTFEGEQLYHLYVYLENDWIHLFKMFSLYEDLYKRRPYKGDLHAHSCHSDGHEEPSVVVANYRKNAYDFFAITDHFLWEPSKEAIDKLKDIPTDLKLFYGEEVHVLDTYHVVNFGGMSSVNEIFRQNKELCYEQADKIASTLTVPEGIDKTYIGRIKWITNEIHKTGGISIFVHPHWIEYAFHVPDKLSDYVFSEGLHDAFELLGGQSVYENTMQTAYYTEQRVMGRKIPIVGSDDSHGSEDADWFKWSWTICFSEDLELESLKNSITDLYSVAVSTYPNESPRAFGTYRMVKYALFLIDEYFPSYEELCFEQGRAMKDYVTGEEGALEILNLLKGRTDKFYNEFFGK